MTEAEQLQIGKLIGVVQSLEHRLDRMDARLHDWMKEHEREAGERDKAIAQLQVFRGQTTALAVLLGSALSLIGQHFIG